MEFREKWKRLGECNRTVSSSPWWRVTCVDSLSMRQGRGGNASRTCCNNWRDGALSRAHRRLNLCLGGRSAVRNGAEFARIRIRLTVEPQFKLSRLRAAQFQICV